MNIRETALIGLVAAVFSLVCCQIFVRAGGHPAQLSSAQISAGLTICLAGVAVGLLSVLCVSAFQESGSRWDRSLGALGLVLGCALLLALVGRHLPRSQAQASQASASPQWIAGGRGTLSPLALGAPR